MAKGQITIFIVLGILIVLGGALLGYVIFLNSSEDNNSQEQQPRNALEAYVDSCHERAVQEGLEIMRMQGGNIDIPLGARTVEVLDSQEIAQTPQGKRLIARPALNKVVYWKDESGYKAFPNLDTMEEELSTYVSEYVEVCVNSFVPFKEDGYVVEFLEPTAEVSFGSSVVSSLSFPITLTKGDEVLTKNTFSYDLPVDVERIYANARQLMEAQERANFLEHHLSKLLSLYAYTGAANSYDIPPTTLPVFDSSCDEKTWQLPLVQEELNRLFKENIPLLQAGRTNISRWSVNEDGSCSGDKCVAQGTLDGFILDVLPEDDRIHVDFSLVESEEHTFYDVKPRSGNTIKGDQTQFPSIFGAGSTCYTRFVFKYTVNAPILVSIRDDWSDRTTLSVGAPNKNFTFRYVIGTNLCGNQEEGCTYSQNPIYYTKANSNFCSNASAGPIQINVIDTYSFNSVADAKLVYTCGSQINTCAIGETNAAGNIVESFPHCLNGVLITEKVGYETSLNVLTTDFNQAQYNVRLYPKQTLESKFVLVHMPTFLKNYELTNGYQRNSCPAAGGNTPEELLEQSLRPIAPEDNAQILGSLRSGISQDVQPVVAPSRGRNILNTYVHIAPLIYDLSLSYVAEGITVEESTIGGKKTPYGSTSGPHAVPLGNIAFSWEPENVYDSSEVTFYIPVEEFAEETFNTRQLTLDLIHKQGTFTSSFNFPEGSLGENCDSRAFNDREVSIQESEFAQLMEPKLI